jgi:hypothetical protein
MAVMLIAAPMFVLAVLSGSLPAPQEPVKVPKDALQLIVTGCLKGRILTASRAPEVDGGELDVPVHRFQMSGKKPLLAEVKRHDGEEIEVTGLVRKLDLKEPGLRVPGGRILITPGQANDPGRPPTRPAERIIVIEVREFRAAGLKCRD